MLPVGCDVLFTPGLWVPLAVCAGNVHVLPGIPDLFSRMASTAAQQFQHAPVTSTQLQLVTSTAEGDLANALATIASQFPSVSIGSYPNCDNDAIKSIGGSTLNALKDGGKQQSTFLTRLSFEGRDAEAVHRATHAASMQIPDCKPWTTELSHTCTGS